MLVTVVVPVFNEEERIAHLSKALLNQSGENFKYEIVFVDNDSTDQSREMLKAIERENPDRVLVEEENKAQSSYAARNRGIEASRGKILAFTDADCVPHATWLEEGVKWLRSNEADLVAGRIDMTFRESNPNTWEYLDAALHLDQASYVKDGWGATANLFVRRNCFDAVGLFNEALISGGDAEFGHRATEAGHTIVYASQAVVRHPARPGMMELLKKQRRIARGFVQNRAFQHVNIPELTLEDFLPTIWVPELEGIDPSFHQKVKIVFGVNLVRLIRAGTRLIGRLRSSS